MHENKQTSKVNLQQIHKSKISVKLQHSAKASSFLYISLPWKLSEGLSKFSFGYRMLFHSFSSLFSEQVFLFVS